MSSRHHIEDFMRGRIIGKIEEGRKIRDVAREFDIAHSVVSRLWKSFKTNGMCSRRHGGGRVRNGSGDDWTRIFISEVEHIQRTETSNYGSKAHESVDQQTKEIFVMASMWIVLLLSQVGLTTWVSASSGSNDSWLLRHVGLATLVAASSESSDF
ncbi:hypothetical protein TNCV_4212091 [Trichonephila clavipes]|nr:hypothetical protein TNCV_4212091 [Trichonephila clavipes]